jgi:nitrate reductase NapAB chaperone NapD
MMERIHIAGMLIHTRPDVMEEAMQALRSISAAEIHPTGMPGKFVGVIECAHEREIGRVIEQMQSLSGVVSISMTSHYIEDAVSLAAEMPE